MFFKGKVVWLCWSFTTAVALIYILLSFVASNSTTASIELTPGVKVDLDLFRITDDTLDLVLSFRANGCEQRPELGKWRLDARTAGVMRFTDPGSDVRIRASAQPSASIVYQAMPLSAYCSDSNVRNMTSNLSVEPGVWRIGPAASSPPLSLHRGINKVSFEVTTVGPPLVGETVKLIVIAPINARYYRSGLGVFVLGLWLWPLFALSQTVWLLCLVWNGIRRRRTLFHDS
jgi:hypothetical protein